MKGLISSNVLFFIEKQRESRKMAEICLTFDKRHEVERVYNDDTRPSEIVTVVGVTNETAYWELKWARQASSTSISAWCTRRRRWSRQYGSISGIVAGENGKINRKGIAYTMKKYNLGNKK